MKINDRHIITGYDFVNSFKKLVGNHFKDIVIHIILSLSVGWMVIINGSSVPLIIMIIFYIVTIFICIMNLEYDKISGILGYLVFSILNINIFFMYPESLVINPIHQVYIAQTNTMHNNKPRITVSIYNVKTKKILGELTFNHGEEQLVEKIFKNTIKAQIVYDYQFPFVFNEELKFFDR